MTRNVLALIIAGSLACLIALAPAALRADVLLIEEVRQADSMDLPPNGLNKADVKARYGEPAQVHAPVGDPPITRWDYDGWSVYFEYDLVLDTVLHKGKALDRKPG